MSGGFFGEARFPIREDDGKFLAVFNREEAGVIVEDDGIALLGMLLEIMADFLATDSDATCCHRSDVFDGHQVAELLDMSRLPICFPAASPRRRQDDGNIIVPFFKITKHSLEGFDTLAVQCERALPVSFLVQDAIYIKKDVEMLTKMLFLFKKIKHNVLRSGEEEDVQCHFSFLHPGALIEPKELGTLFEGFLVFFGNEDIRWDARNLEIAMLDGVFCGVLLALSRHHEGFSPADAFHILLGKGIVVVVDGMKPEEFPCLVVHIEAPVS